jgi:DNA-binding phage protein
MGTVVANDPQTRKENMAKAKPPAGLCESLRQAIRDSGLTQYRVAKLAGLEPGTIYRFLTAERDLRFESAGKVADALGYKLIKK